MFLHMHPHPAHTQTLSYCIFYKHAAYNILCFRIYIMPWNSLSFTTLNKIKFPRLNRATTNNFVYLSPKAGFLCFPSDTYFFFFFVFTKDIIFRHCKQRFPIIYTMYTHSQVLVTTMRALQNRIYLFTSNPMWRITSSTYRMVWHIHCMHLFCSFALWFYVIFNTAQHAPTTSPPSMPQDYIVYIFPRLRMFSP